MGMTHLFCRFCVDDSMTISWELSNVGDLWQHSGQGSQCQHLQHQLPDNPIIDTRWPSLNPWKWMVGIRSFSFGAFRPIFRGENVSFPGGYWLIYWAPLKNTTPFGPLGNLTIDGFVTPGLPCPTSRADMVWVDLLGRGIQGYPRENDSTVDGRNPANQVVDRVSHYLQGFIHP